jgi:hypothetical protein
LYIYNCPNLGTGGVELLNLLPLLDVLSLTGSGFDADAVEEFRRARPNCTVYFAD